MVLSVLASRWEDERMKTFLAMVMGFLLFLATSIVLAHPHIRTVLPAVTDSTTLFATELAPGKANRNAAFLLATENTTLFSATLEPQHVQIVPVTSHADGDAQTLEMHKYMD